MNKEIEIRVITKNEKGKKRFRYFKNSTQLTITDVQSYPKVKFLFAENITPEEAVRAASIRGDKIGR